MRMSNNVKAFCRACGAALYPNYMEGAWEHFSKGCEFSGKQHRADKTKSNGDPISYPSWIETTDFAVPVPPDTKRGLYAKFTVERTDGSSAPGAKHHDCRYFVLDLNHDSHAIPAILAYARSARKDGFEALAGDLFLQVRRSREPYLLTPGEIALALRAEEREINRG